MRSSANKNEHPLQQKKGKMKIMKIKLAVLVAGLLSVNGIFACETTALVGCGWNHSWPSQNDPACLGATMTCNTTTGGNIMIAQSVEGSGLDSSTWYVAYCTATETCTDCLGHVHQSDDSYSTTGSFASGNSC